MIGYAGSLDQPGYLHCLAELSQRLSEVPAKLLLIGPIQRFNLCASGMLIDHVTVEPPLGSAELVRRLQNEADILVLPSSFRAEDAIAMETLFPSKLVDYFASGVLCLVWAPPYSTIARWVHSESGVAEYVSSPNAYDVITKIKEMRNNPERMIAMAKRASVAAMKYFSPQIAEDKFLSSIAGCPSLRNNSAEAN
jgi:glycosyltransferase involved in cell wall biosynthesis